MSFKNPDAISSTGVDPIIICDVRPPVRHVISLILADTPASVSRKLNATHVFVRKMDELLISQMHRSDVCPVLVL